MDKVEEEEADITLLATIVLILIISLYKKPVKWVIRCMESYRLCRSFDHIMLDQSINRTL